MVGSGQYHVFKPFRTCCKAESNPSLSRPRCVHFPRSSSDQVHDRRLRGFPQRPSSTKTLRTRSDSTPKAECRIGLSFRFILQPPDPCHPSSGKTPKFLLRGWSTHLHIRKSIAGWLPRCDFHDTLHVTEEGGTRTRQRGVPGGITMAHQICEHLSRREAHQRNQKPVYPPQNPGSA